VEERAPALLMEWPSMQTRSFPIWRWRISFLRCPFDASTGSSGSRMGHWRPIPRAVPKWWPWERVVSTNQRATTLPPSAPTAMPPSFCA